MKTCCFCSCVIGGDAVEIQRGRIPVFCWDSTAFRHDEEAGVDYAHEGCFDRAVAAFQTPMAVASTGGGR